MIISPRLPQVLRSVLGVSASLFAWSWLMAQDEEPPTVTFPGAETAEAEAAPATAVQPAAPAPATAADYMRTVLVRSPMMNESGSHLAALYSGGSEVYQLLVRDRATGEDIFLGGGEVAFVDEFRWLDDTHIAYNLLGMNGADLALMVADIHDPANAYPIYQYGAARIVAVPPESPLNPLVWISVGASDGQPVLAELDAATNRGGFINMRGEAEEAGLVEVAQRHADTIMSEVPRPEGDSLGYLPDGQGNLGFAYTAIEGQVVMQIWDGKEWFFSPLGFERADVVDVGEEPGQLVMRIPGGPGETASLRFVDAVSGDLGDVLIQDAEYDFNGTIFRDPASRAIVGAFYDRNGPRSTWFDEGYRQVQKALNDYFPGRIVRLMDVSASGGVMLVAVTSDRDPISYFTIDLKSKKIDLFHRERPWLSPGQMSPISILKYTTADGKKLDAYVTLPAEASKENPVPLVVLPHGGPWTRTSWGFDAEAQLLASQGYAILQPNYRGSTGYDWMFTEAQRGDLIMMHDDVTRAVRTVLKTGVIDAERIAISGGGFGGYLALTALVEEPDLYKCGISVSGLFDWQRVANEIGPGRNNHPTYGALFALLGDPGSEAAKYDAISSGRRVDQVKAPLLVVKEKSGESLEAIEGDELIDDLLSAGVPYEVHQIDGTVLALETRTQLFERMIDFLDKNL